jgi:circadian clock protein KaiC
MVVDPLSALAQGGARLSALAVAQRLMVLAKERGVTLLGTSLMEGADPTTEAAKIRVSTIADTWIHLTYVASGGERNRALTVVKARGIGHSNQVRELLLTDEGVTLTDVYTSRGQVLMGALRAEHEAEERLETERLHAEMERKRRELQSAEAETLAKIKALEYEAETRRGESERQLEVNRTSLTRELEARRIEVERLEHQERSRRRFAEERVSTLRTLRRVDADQAEGRAPD